MFELPKKILILRLSSIGDIILTSSLIRSVRSKVGKNARIDFVVKKEFSELVKFNHNLSFTFEYDSTSKFSGLKKLANELKNEKYDLVIDLHDNLRTKYLRNFCLAKEVVSIDKESWKRFKLIHFRKNDFVNHLHIVEKYFKSLEDFNVKYDGKGNDIYIPDEIQFSISSRFSELKLNNFNKVIGICPGAKHFTKIWPTEKFEKCVKILSLKYNAKILLFGGQSDLIYSQKIINNLKKETDVKYLTDFTGKLSLLETAQAFEYCDLIIANDTGLMHLASAKQKPIVAIFGSTTKEFGFTPFETKNIIVENYNLECRPCTHIGKDKCPKKHFKCMVDISEDEVLKCVEKLI